MLNLICCIALSCPRTGEGDIVSGHLKGSRYCAVLLPAIKVVAGSSSLIGDRDRRTILIGCLSGEIRCAIGSRTVIIRDFVGVAVVMDLHDSRAVGCNGLLIKRLYCEAGIALCYSFGLRAGSASLRFGFSQRVAVVRQVLQIMLNDVLRVGSGGPLGNRNEVIGGHGGRRRGNFICVGRVSRVVPLPTGEGITSTGRIRITIGGDSCLVRSSFLHIFEDHFTVYAVGISDGMARHCDFTGGDGEGDIYVRTLAVLDREGRFAVEGGVVLVADFYETRLLRVDLDGVGVGVGIGGYLLSVYRVGRFIFGKRFLIQFPFFHVVFAKGFRRDAGGQGIPDGAVVQTGDDGLGDFCKFYVQLLCIVRIIGKLLTYFCRLRRNFSAQIFTDGNLAPVVRNINFLLRIKADGIELGMVLYCISRCNCLRKGFRIARITCSMYPIRCIINRQKFPVKTR